MEGQQQEMFYYKPEFLVDINCGNLRNFRRSVFGMFLSIDNRLTVHIRVVNN